MTKNPHDTLQLELPQFILEDSKTQEAANDVIDIVRRTANLIEEGDRTSAFIFKRYCYETFNEIDDYRSEQEANMRSNEGADPILEGLHQAGIKFQMLGFAIAAFGRHKQMEIYCGYLSKLFSLSEKYDNGSPIRTQTPLVMISEIMYGVGVIACLESNFSYLGILSNQRKTSRYSSSSGLLGLHSRLFYLDSIGDGYGKKAIAHIEGYLGNMKFFRELFPEIETQDQLNMLIVKANFILGAFNIYKGERFYVYFGGFYRERFTDIIGQIKNNKNVQEQLKTFFGMKTNENAKDVFKALVPQMVSMMRIQSDRNAFAVEDFD